MSEERTRDLPDNRSFEERLFAHLEAMETRLEAMETRLEAMEARFDARLDGLENRFDSMEARLKAMEVRFDARFDSLDSRVQALEARRLDTKPIWERALAEILNVKDRVENIERKFDLLTIDMMQLRGDQRRLGSLFDALSSKPA